ncbi:hypothetical protein TNCV_775121, partial [Trichonephila clavipes]
MMVLFVQSVNGMCNALLTVWVSGEPLINDTHRAAHLAWAREHRDYSVENWKRVAWSDKYRFQLFNADRSLRI